MIPVKILAWGLLFYLIYAGFLFVFQRHILFPRYQIPPSPSPAEDNPRFEQIWVKTGFGNVEAWLLPARNQGSADAAPLLVFAHGNAERIDFWLDEFEDFTALGMAVLLVEYPGYGRSDGDPSQQTITETFVAAYDQVTPRVSVDASRVILMGRSLGGGAVCALGAERPCAAVILMSTFTSVKAFAKRFLVPSALVRDPFDNLAFVKTCDKPILVVHGQNDELIPLRHGRALFQAAKHGQMHTYSCQHNDCPPSWDRFCQDVVSFLTGAGLIEGPGRLSENFHESSPTGS